MNDCLNDEKLQAWLDGELPPETAVATQLHVTTCARCSANARTARQTLSLADDGWEADLPIAIPAVRLRARLAAASAAPSAATRLPGGLRRAPFWGLAAAVVILAIGLTMIFRNGPQQTSPSVPQETVSQTNQEAPEPVAPVAVAADLQDSLNRSSRFAPPSRQLVERPPKRERRSAVESETTRHLEQTQQLLRSIRNSETETVDWAYDLQLSRELLNRNRLLRRRAAQKQDAAAERMLVHVEPILLDITNLSEQPAADEIDSLKAMIREQSIIAELRLYAARTGS